jgi:hypothetical protein
VLRSRSIFRPKSLRTVRLLVDRDDRVFQGLWALERLLDVEVVVQMQLALLGVAGHYRSVSLEHLRE